MHKEIDNMKKKEVKIILCSGISITLDSKDDIKLIGTDVYEEEFIDLTFEDISEIPKILMTQDALIIIKHHISTGEYMEYAIPREKITWCYYSETDEKEG